MGGAHPTRGRSPAGGGPWGARASPGKGGSIVGGGGQLWRAQSWALLQARISQVGRCAGYLADSSALPVRRLRQRPPGDSVGKRINRRCVRTSALWPTFSECDQARSQAPSKHPKAPDQSVDCHVANLGNGCICSGAWKTRDRARQDIVHGQGSAASRLSQHFAFGPCQSYIGVAFSNAAPIACEAGSHHRQLESQRAARICPSTTGLEGKASTKAISPSVREADGDLQGTRGTMPPS